MKKSIRFILARYMHFEEDFDSSESEFKFCKIFEPLTLIIDGAEKKFSPQSIVLVKREEELSIFNYRTMYNSPSLKAVRKHFKDTVGLFASAHKEIIKGVAHYIPFYEVDLDGERKRVVVGRSFIDKTHAIMSAILQYIKDRNNDFVC